MFVNTREVLTRGLQGNWNNQAESLAGRSDS